MSIPKSVFKSRPAFLQGDPCKRWKASSESVGCGNTVNGFLLMLFNNGFKSNPVLVIPFFSQKVPPPRNADNELYLLP